MSRTTQPFLPSFSFKKSLSFGGMLGANGKTKSGKISNPKTARPIATKQAMHIVLKSTQARGAKSLLLHSDDIEFILNKQADSLGITLYNTANAGNHLHIVLRASS